MQEAILRLTRYWTERGCVLGQPFNTEVGAGTLNPATFLRVLGPEPWSTVYVEPSVRPDDSRYGDNPNRMQTHTQLQVILKPDPGNAQELYLQSLAEIGVDARVHDIRFVEDNWESPALGAWGLGWEVWLDGLEITQFTYFQQAGGLALDPPSVEITYGLERILMALQHVTHFKEIQFAPGIPYGEVVGQAELEMSTYYLDEADVSAVRAMFELYEAEARRLLERRLPLPAHYYVLKCSHAFNILDARGGVGTTERARSFRRMRGLAHDVALLWTARRDELGHPLGISRPRSASTTIDPIPSPASPSTFLLELGFEELPAADVTKYTESLATTLEASLTEHRLSHGQVKTFGSPRRIIAVVDQLAPSQADRSLRTRGPRLDIAFDASGAPTPAGEGFARKQGVAISELVEEVDGDVRYVAVTKQHLGRAVTEVLAEALPGVIAAVTTGKGMRWSAGPGYSASRPLRWIVALVGGATVPFTYADVASGRRTRVLRNAGTTEVEMASATTFLADLRGHDVEYDASARRQRIIADAAGLAAATGGAIDVEADSAVLDEVTNLVENPQAILGSFSPAHLRLPPEVLTVVMRKHQRYLPVRDAAGELLPLFVTIANGPVDPPAVRQGNEAVLQARYADAAFFYDRDRERTLESFREGLRQLTFEERVGSMFDRAERIERLAIRLGHDLGLTAQQAAVLGRAAHLARADLATSLVIELSSLAGQMGRAYARADGEPTAVADAIFESTLPRHAGDDLPSSIEGALLSIADRADSLVALFAAGAKPTGSNDPYALRRAATGLVQVIVKHGLPLGIGELLARAAEAIDLPVPSSLLQEIREFVDTRHEVRLTDEGHRIELVRAVAPSFDRPADAARTLAALESLSGTPDFARLVAAYRRVRRISQDTAPGPVDPTLLEPAEEALWSAFQEVAPALDDTSLPDFVARFEPLVARIDTFFVDIMVMTDDEAVRTNRLRLLATIRESGAGLVDWEALPEA